MGTHPIFESDFDCLTEMRTLTFFIISESLVFGACPKATSPEGLQFLRRTFTTLSRTGQYTSYEPCWPSMVGFSCKKYGDKEDSKWRSCVSRLYTHADYKGTFLANTVPPAKITKLGVSKKY